MTLWNLAELRDELGDLLHSTPGQVDVSFNTRRQEKAIRRAYEREVRKAKFHGDVHFFKEYMDFTWPANTVEMVVPDAIRGLDMFDTTDVTTTDPGTPILWSEAGRSGQLTWKNHSTIQWGRTGPTRDTTVRFIYFARTSALTADSDVPYLIPPGYQEIIVWSAAVDLRTRADEGAPGKWLEELEELRLDLWKGTSRGRPMRRNNPTVYSSQTETDNGYVY